MTSAAYVRLAFTLGIQARLHVERLQKNIPGIPHDLALQCGIEHLKSPLFTLLLLYVVPSRIYCSAP